MTGEELLWFKIAARLKMSPSEARAKHTVSQFRRWRVFFDQEINDFHRQDYITARVAYEVYQLRAALCTVFKVKLPDREVKDFISKFEFKNEVNLEIMTEEDRTEKMKAYCAHSQAVWLGALGLDTDGKPLTDATGKPLNQPKGQQPPVPPQEAGQEGEIKAPTPQTPTGGKTRRVIKGRKD